MIVREIVGEFEAAGVALQISGERIRIWYPTPCLREKLVGKVAFLRAHREEVAQFLRERDPGTAARSLYFWGRRRNGKPRDYYGWRADVTIDAILSIPTPTGLVVWLDKHSPDLYRELTSLLPDRISRAWNERIPYEDFDAICFDVVDVYQRAVKLYEQFRKS